MTQVSLISLNMFYLQNADTIHANMNIFQLGFIVVVVQIFNATRHPRHKEAAAGIHKKVKDLYESISLILVWPHKKCPTRHPSDLKS